MAENLNFTTVTGSMCPGGDTLNCESKGRWYNWETASWACPFAWHLPTKDEWAAILSDLSVTYQTAGTALKATTGWGANPGTNSSGFSAVTAGYAVGTTNYGLTTSANWWTSTKDTDTTKAFTRYLTNSNQNLLSIAVATTRMLSVRCIAD